MHTPECSCLPPPPFFHSTPIKSCRMSTDSVVGHQSIDMSRGSLPPDCSSVDIEMFAPPTGVVTPFSVNQLYSVNRDVWAVQGTGRRDLPSDLQSTDAREEARMQLHPVVPQRGTVLHGDPSHCI